jgi:hypothetical protein
MKTLALVAAALLFSGPIALAGQETLWTGTRPNDYFDLLLLKESTERWVAIVGLIVDRGSRGRDLREDEPCDAQKSRRRSRTSSTRSSSATTWISIPRAQVLTENQRLQNLKDVFQTIAQGSAALWTPKEG